MNYFDAIKKNVEDGREGLNKGVPFGIGLDRITAFMGGIQPARNDLIGGNTGTGKTAIVDQMYVLGPLEWLLANPESHYKLHYKYNTLEISVIKKLTKWTCQRIYLKHGILLSSEDLLSKKQKHVLPEEIYDLFILEREWIENLQEFIDFRESATPAIMLKDETDWFSSHGEVKDVQVRRKNGEMVTLPKFFPKDRFHVLMNITDTLGKIRKQEGLTKKQTIDTYSSNSLYTRNLYGASHVFISQFNRDIADISRMKFSELTPLLEDFKETGDPAEDADTVFAIFSPKRYDLKSYKGYELKSQTYDIQDYFRMFFIIKNRDGPDAKNMAMSMLGECGYFKEIPKLQEFKDDPNLYEKIYKELQNVRRIKYTEPATS